MIDIDVARRLKDAGLPWEPADGDLFSIDTELLRDEAFMLSPMVVERGISRSGQHVFRFNGTTEWALDTVEQHEAIWIPREEQLRDALGDAFVSLHREQSGAYVVRFAPAGDADPGSGAAPGTDTDADPGAGAGTGTGTGTALGADADAGGLREVRAPHAEDAYAGALLTRLTRA
ncbi:hypothetical protein ACFQS2_06495 [Brachybacterium sp. GCM10030267]|uniref:hypothetical protein n=1 Tax=unclassified Brachybacterium TaxID=2623841 RepID=UPI0036208322